jgi:SAM-dependent methyltransferase
MFKFADPINPFFAAHRQRLNSLPETDPYKPVYARLPRIPVTASPVPTLTSLYHSAEAGDYGDRSYPGNCGGNLIKDLLMYFRPGLVFDPMAGSGTCRDVCDELGIPCIAWDIHDGYDACDPAYAPAAETFDFVWAHPAYWRMKLYADNPRDLSRAPTLDAFLVRYRQFIRNAARSLKPGGKLAILMGDYQDREAGFVPLVYHTKRLAFEAGLRQHCTDIIRFSHGASSGQKVYRTSFIPGLHDVCMVFERCRHQKGVLS